MKTFVKKYLRISEAPTFVHLVLSTLILYTFACILDNVLDNVYCGD